MIYGAPGRTKFELLTRNTADVERLPVHIGYDRIAVPGPTSGVASLAARFWIAALRLPIHKSITSNYHAW